MSSWGSVVVAQQDGASGLAAVPRWSPLEDVVDAARVGLEEALEAMEELLDGGLAVLVRTLEEHVIAIGHDGEEVALLARPLRPSLPRTGLNRRARRVGGEDLAGHRVTQHRRDDGAAERVAELLHLSTHGAAVERGAVCGELLLEAVVRHAQRPARGHRRQSEARAR